MTGAFERRCPRTKALALWLGKAILAGLIWGLWGGYMYHRGAVDMQAEVHAYLEGPFADDLVDALAERAETYWDDRADDTQADAGDTALKI